ncbi:hypothetical protein SNE40_020146 [Patella caerulea]|uniref:Fibrinogen C-terminal domain-containing protein n=1 Tax=Patella caerulea TaxID=87958 RepID=A0AAN8GAB7_PATCE
MFIIRSSLESIDCSTILFLDNKPSERLCLIMARWEVLLQTLSFLTYFWVVSATLHSQYIKTRVFREGSDCLTDVFNAIITKDRSHSLVDCSTLCSSAEKCRRFMFDKETKMCSMFESGENCITDEEVDNIICYRQNYVCDELTCTRCPIGYYGDQCQHIIQDCSEGRTKSLYPEKKLMSFIQPSLDGPIIEVKCTFKYGGFTYIHYRKYSCLALDFNKTMDEYANGFGHPHGNYWLGLEHIYNIFQNHLSFSLQFVISFDVPQLSPAQGYYYRFNITDRSDYYRITLRSYSGHHTKPSGDSLTSGAYNIDGRPFSTYDDDFSNHDCPDRFKGGWWYLDDPVCCRANLNGNRTDTSFESSWQGQDNLGNRTSFYDVTLRVVRNTV